MQSLMFLACFVQKLSKKNLWGVSSTPLGKGRVNPSGTKGFGTHTKHQGGVETDPQVSQERQMAQS